MSKKVFYASCSLNSLFQNKHPFVLLLPLLQNMSQTLGPNAKNADENGVIYDPSLSGSSSRIHISINPLDNFFGCSEGNVPTR